MVIVTFIGLYLLSAGISLALFSYLKGGSNLTYNAGDLADARSQILDLPKTETCPINGELFTKIEKDIWDGRRPITAVIENHLDSRPPSGLSRADIVHEAVAEGGITRFLSVFYCGAAKEDVRIGPIRSARVYFINWAAEYADNPLFVHSGGANNICGDCPNGIKLRGTLDPRVDAFTLLAELGWRFFTGNALDAGTNAGYPEVWRDYERLPGVASEHTFMGSTDKLYEVGSERGFAYKNEDGVAWDDNYVSWKFTDDKPTTPKATKIEFEFWSNRPDYDVAWDYNQNENIYLRSNGGQRHYDLDNDQQMYAKNVVIQFVPEEGPVDKEYHMFYDVIGSGDALVFQNGNVIEATWKKSSTNSRTIFYDLAGDEIEFVRGKIWIEAVPEGNNIDY